MRLRQRHSLSTVSSSSLFCPTALLAGGRNAARLRWRCLSLTVGARASEDICRGSIPSADRFLRFTKACLLLNSSPESPLTTRSQSTAARVTGEIGDNKINSYVRIAWQQVNIRPSRQTSSITLEACSTIRCKEPRRTRSISAMRSRRATRNSYSFCRRCR